MTIICTIDKVKLNEILQKALAEMFPTMNIGSIEVVHECLRVEMELKTPFILNIVK